MSPVSDTAKLVTATDLMEMPEDGYRYELVHGQLVHDRPPGPRHGATASRLQRRLGTWAEEQGGGEVFAAETGFKLRSDPDTVRAPDISFVATQRLPAAGLPDDYLGAPDVAIEVLSPSDRQSAIAEKIQDYLSAGCQQVWVVSIEMRTVTVYKTETDVSVYTAADTLDGDGPLAGFQFDVADIFAGVYR